MPHSLTLGICTFNRGSAFLPTLEALTRLQNPEGRLSRICIINNASTDSTAEVVRSFIRDHPESKIELLDEPTPGKLHAMRRLFAATTDPFVAIIDDDTIPAPNWAAALLAVMDQHPRCGIAGGPVINQWEFGPTKLAKIYRRSLGDFDLGPTATRLEKPDSFLLGASLLCRRRAVEESGWLSNSLLPGRTGTDLQSGAEDAELCIRVRQTGWEIWYEPAAPMQHLIPARRQTRAYLAKLRADVHRSMPAIYHIAGLVPDGAHAEAQARKAQRQYWKTLLFDWRPTRRTIRLAERRGRLAGWTSLAKRLTQPIPR